MTDCSRAGAGEGDGRGARYEQIVFSFGEDVKPTLKFDASAVTADAGLAPLRELDERLGLTELAAALIDDLRRPGMVVHPVDRLLRETVYAYAAADLPGEQRIDPKGRALRGEMRNHLRAGPVSRTVHRPTLV